MGTLVNLYLSRQCIPDTLIQRITHNVVGIRYVQLEQALRAQFYKQLRNPRHKFGTLRERFHS